MTALVMHGVELTPTVAAEILALAPDVPADMSTDATLAAIHGVLTRHHCDPAECLALLSERYGDHPDEIASRMSRAVVLASRLSEVTP